MTTPNQTITLCDNTKPNNYMERGWWKSCGPQGAPPSGSPEGLWVTRGQQNYTSCNYQPKQFHCLTTPNQTIALYNNTKPNNSNQTKQFNCLTTCKNSILWQEDIAKNNVSSPGEENCVGERVVKKLWPTRGPPLRVPGGVVGHSRTTKLYKL